MTIPDALVLLAILAGVAGGFIFGYTFRCLEEKENGRENKEK